MCYLMDIPEFKGEVGRLYKERLMNRKDEVINYIRDRASYIREACSILSSRKLMWGTDIPAGLKNHTYSSLRNYLTESKLFLEEELEDIYYNTAKKVYFK